MGYYYKRLRDLREDRDMNQTQIAGFLGIRQEQYSKYESGKREIPVHHLIRLAQLHDKSLDYIVGLTNEPKKFW